MKLERAWFFEQMRKYTASMKSQLEEDMESLKTSIAEHEAGLEVLTKADVGPHIREQFANIIKRHKEELLDREVAYRTAVEVYDTILALDEKTTLDEYIKLLTAILQIPDPQENESLQVAEKNYVFTKEAGWGEVK